MLTFVAELAGTVFLLAAISQRRSASFDVACFAGLVLVGTPLIGAATFPLVFLYLGFRVFSTHRRSRPELLRGPLYTIALVGLIAFTFNAIAFGELPTLHSNRPFQIVSAFLYAVFTHRQLRSHRDIILAMEGLTASGVALAVPEIFRVAAGGQIHALTGSFGAGPIASGRIAGLGLTCALLLVLYSDSDKPRRLYLMAIPILAVGTVVTGTRSALVGFAVALAAVLLGRSELSKARKTLITLPLLPAAIWAASRLDLRIFDLAVNSADASTQTGRNVTVRLDVWTQSFETFKQNWLTGAGIGNFSGDLPPAHNTVSAHSVFLEVAAESGFFAVLCLLMVVLVAHRGASTMQRVALLFTLTTFSVSGHLGVSHHLFLILAIASLRLPANRTPQPLQTHDQIKLAGRS